jgi:hypothetical protein
MDRGYVFHPSDMEYGGTGHMCQHFCGADIGLRPPPTKPLTKPPVSAYIVAHEKRTSPAKETTVSVRIVIALFTMLLVTAAATQGEPKKDGAVSTKLIEQYQKQLEDNGDPTFLINAITNNNIKGLSLNRRIKKAPDAAGCSPGSMSSHPTSPPG